MPRAEWWPRVAVLLGAPVLGHFLLSPFGFNPTDDGFFTALSRRLLEGEVPHRDFITLRPALTPLLHAPVVWLGGEHTFLVSRLVVWLELAAIAWCWVRLAARCLGWPSRGGEQVGLALLVLMLNHGVTNHTAWATTDGLLLASGAFVLLDRGGREATCLGYLLLGLAPLCKQSFAPLVPLAVLAFGHLRRPAWIVFALVPAAVYAAVLGVAGALGPTVEQLAAHPDVATAGITGYRDVPTLALGLAAGAGIVALGGRGVPALLATMLPFAVVAGAATQLATGRYLWAPSFFLFAAAAGATLTSAMRGLPWRLGLLAVATAWSVSLSLGYNTPARAAGVLALAIVVLGVEAGGPPVRRAAGVALLATLVAVVPCYWLARTRHLYRDRPRAELTAELGGIFPGAAGLYTNPRTAAVLRDLRAAVAGVGDRPYVILPDFAGYWVAASARNPLPADMVYMHEFPTAALQRRYLSALAARRGRLVAIVQKYRADALHLGLVPLPHGEYSPILDAVRSEWRKLDETEFFEIYG